MAKEHYPSIFIDTSAWVALNQKKDTYHKEAKSFIEKIKKGELNFGLIHSSELILQETYTYLLYNYNCMAAVDIVNRILQSNIIIHPLNSLKFNEVWKKIENDKRELSFVDWSTVIYMEKYNIKHIFTFDSDFLSVGFEKYP